MAVGGDTGQGVAGGGKREQENVINVAGDCGLRIPGIRPKDWENLVRKLAQPGFEPRSAAWEARRLST